MILSQENIEKLGGAISKEGRMSAAELREALG